MFWQQNTEALLRHFPACQALFQTLQDLGEADEPEPMETMAGDFGLMYQGVPLHSPVGSMLEAETTARESCRPALDRVHLILGLGLGYLVQAAAERSPGPIVVYEPHLPILKFTLENINLSKVLESGQVRIVTTLPELLATLNPLLFTADPLDILCLPGYALLMKDALNPLLTQLEALLDDRKRDYRTARFFHQQWNEQFFMNLPHLPACLSMKDLQGKAPNKPAIIISRGPSLDAALPAIAAMKNQAVLIAVGAALHHLHRAGITPDFAVFMDSRGMEAQLHGLPEHYLQNIVFLLSTFTQPDCYETPSRAKVRFTMPSDQVFAEWMAKGSPAFPADRVMEGCGTVSHMAYQTAYVLDCNPIVLVGQDLAFPNNQVYAGGTVVKTDEQGHLCLEKTETLFTARQQMASVPGQNGETLQTLANFKAYIRQFEKTAADNAASPCPKKLYNASLGGARIDGYELRSLDAFGGEWEDFKQPDWLSEIVAIPEGKAHRSFENLQTRLRKLKADLIEAIDYLENRIAQNDSDPTTPMWLAFLKQHPLISHFLVLEMIDDRQSYYPLGKTTSEIADNQRRIRAAYMKYRKMLQEQALPWVAQAEDKLLASFSATPTPISH